MTSTTMNFTADDIDAARTTLAQARPGEVVPMVLLTDEEITILDGVGQDQLVPTPWLDEQDADRALLGRVALRSLLAREMVLPVEHPGGRVTIQAHPGITGPLVLRRTGQAVLTCERATATGKHWLFAYLHEHDGGTVVLEEEISAAGNHAFSLYPRDLLGERLARTADPERRARATRGPMPIPAAQFPEFAGRLPELRDAEAVSTLSGIPATHDTVATVTTYAGPDGVWVLRDATPAGGAAATTLSLTPTGPDDLALLPGELLA